MLQLVALYVLQNTKQVFVEQVFVQEQISCCIVFEVLLHAHILGTASD